MDEILTLEQAVPKPEPDFEDLRRVLTRDGVPARVPFYELFADNEFMEKLFGRPVRTRADTIEFYYKAGYDYVPMWPTYRMKVGGFTTAKDDHPIRDRAGFESFAWPAEGSVDFREFETCLPLLPSGMKAIGQTGGLFELLHQLVGYERLCLLFYDDPDLVRDVLARLMVLYREMYRGMAAIPEIGAIVLSDDLGFKTQPLVSGAILREFIFPLYRELAGIIHAGGKACILHSCGQVFGFVDEFAAMGIDAKHSYEDAILPVEEAYRLYADRISILGGLDLDRMVRDTPEKVAARAERLTIDLGRRGAYALGTGNSVADYVPVRNYLAMIAAGWRVRSGK
jgi:uroporphyrinogen decarboxylase